MMENTNEKFEHNSERREIARRTTARRPVKKKRQIRPEILVTVVVLLVSSVILLFTPIFNIGQIVVEGNKTIKANEVIVASGIALNKNIFRTNMGKAEDAIRQLNYVEDVKISRLLPNKVKIEVVEGDVAAYFKMGNKYIGINKNGQTLCSVGKVSASKKAPVVKGITLKEAVIGQNVVVVQTGRFDTLLSFLETFDEKNLTADIEYFDISESEYISFKHRHLRVEFGNTSDYDNKFSWLDYLLDTMGKDVMGEANLINFEYPVYRDTVE